MKKLALLLAALPCWSATITWDQPGLSLTTPNGTNLTITPASGSIDLTYGQNTIVAIGTATVTYAGSTDDMNISLTDTLTVNGQPCIHEMRFSSLPGQPWASLTTVVGQGHRGCAVPVEVTPEGLQLAIFVDLENMYFNTPNGGGGVPGTVGDVLFRLDLEAGPTPEPATMLLTGAGLLAVILSRRRFLR